jgi:DNA polymerase-3 subunit delta'
MKLNWLDDFTDAWLARVRQERVPHALLLLGAAGTGKRAVAAWLARERLGLAGVSDGPQYPLEIPEHPDLRWLRPPEDKHSVGIEQVRELVTALSLTSYSGGGKVAIIDPANAMTASAANSLLKTLEEPSGDALIVLVADRLGHLPATIVSRCQRVSLPLPDARTSIEWLQQVERDSDWPEVLRHAGYAPLAAIEVREKMPQAQAMAREFSDLAERRGSPVEVAARWSKMEPAFVLDWLSSSIQETIRQVSGVPSASVSGGPPDSVLRRIDRRNLFCYLDIINRLRGQAAGSFNVQLTLESLLIDWASGLKDCHRSFGPGELLPGSAQG